MLWGRLRAGRRALWRGGAGLPATRGADGGDRAADRGVRRRGRAELRRASKREMKCAGKAGKHLVAQPPSGVIQHLWSIWHEASTCHVRSCATWPCQIDSSRDGRVEPPKGPGSWGAQVALLNASAPACSIDRFQAGGRNHGRSNWCAANSGSRCSTRYVSACTKRASGPVSSLAEPGAEAAKPLMNYRDLPELILVVGVLWALGADGWELALRGVH